MTRQVLIADPALHHGFRCIHQLRRLFAQQVIHVSLIQLTDIGDIPQNEAVVRALSEGDQRAGDDIDEPPGKFTECRGVTFPES